MAASLARRPYTRLVCIMVLLQLFQLCVHNNTKFTFRHPSIQIQLCTVYLGNKYLDKINNKL
jgi:hypothetical protein